MTTTVAQLRADFPEFASTSTYPASQVNYWLTLAYSMLNAGRWGRQLDFGVAMFVAHNLVLEARAQYEAANGGVPGGQVGALSSKSVDKVSISYDVSAGIETGAGHWNLSIYGTRFIRLARMFGAGPIQLGIGCAPSGFVGAWTGPNVTPGFTNFG